MADYNNNDYENDSFKDLAEIMGQANFENVTATSGDNNFDPLPDGYYLCEVEKAILRRTKETNKPMVSFTLNVVTDGIIVKTSEDGEDYLVRTPNTKNHKIFKNWMLDDKDKLEKFASNMLKFEDPSEEPGTHTPLLEKECFTAPEILREALAALETSRIYVLTKTTEKNGKTNTWVSLVTWENADKFELDSVPEL